VKRKDLAKNIRCQPKAYARVHGIARKHRIPLGRAVELLIDAWDVIGQDAQYRVLTGAAERPTQRRRGAVPGKGAPDAA
jgi:hypothetical protein